MLAISKICELVQKAHINCAIDLKLFTLVSKNSRINLVASHEEEIGSFKDQLNIVTKENLLLKWKIKIFTELHISKLICNADTTPELAFITPVTLPSAAATEEHEVVVGNWAPTKPTVTPPCPFPPEPLFTPEVNAVVVVVNDTPVQLTLSPPPLLPVNVDYEETGGGD